MEEIWKTIKDYDEYKVSNYGYIKSFKFGKEKLLKNCKGVHGYPVTILTKNGKSKTYFIHRIVATCFIDNKDNKPYINHKDGIKTNNVVTNLEWVTASENMIHAYHVLNIVSPLKGKKHWIEGRFGSLHPRSKQIRQLTETGILVKEWDSTMSIERELKLSHSRISMCCLGKISMCGGYRWQYIIK